MAQALRRELPAWDLTDLYAGLDDPQLETDLNALKARAAEFERQYKGTIALEGLDAAHLRAALDAYEALARAQARPLAYAQLQFTTDTQDPRRGALLQKTREAASAMGTHLVFFDLEIGRIPDETFAALREAETLASYRHYLDHERRLARHHLSEPEEKILVETANARGPAFGRLFSEVTARTRFPFEHGGKTEALTQSQVLAKLYDPDRAVRQAAASAVTDGVRGNAHVNTFIYNTLMHEKDVLDRLRGFERPEAARHLSNEVDAEAVDAMVAVCVDNFDVVADYYRLKKRLLGLEELTHVDRYAPLSQVQAEIPFDQARGIVLDAYAKFSPRLRELTEPFFSENWIDAALAEGKQGGAYCAGVAPDLHPYVFMNYTDTARDVMTLAHELGHGIHDRLASRNHMLDYHPPLPLAETASTFGEMLVFDSLMGQLDDEREKLSLVCGKIEDTFGTVFRQVAMFRFEQRAHAARRERGELRAEDLNALWQETQQAMYGDSLALGEEHAWWWLYIPHVIQMPFYVYAYAFGELLVLSLYAQYQREPEGFVERYFELLAAGGSVPPAELVGRLGFDIGQKSFWQAGCDLVRERVAQAKALAG